MEPRPPAPPTPVGPPKPGTEGLTLADVGGIDPDQGEVVIGARVRVRLSLGLHREPRVVDHAAWPAGAGHLDRRADRQRPGVTSVGAGLPARARAVGGLAEVDVRSLGEDEVRGALRPVRERHHARMHGRLAGRRPSGGDAPERAPRSPGRRGTQTASRCRFIRPPVRTLNPIPADRGRMHPGRRSPLRRLRRRSVSEGRRGRSRARGGLRSRSAAGCGRT